MSGLEFNWDMLCKALFTLEFASNFKNEFYGNKCWCSYLTFAFNGKDQRKTQTQTLSLNDHKNQPSVLGN